MKKSLGFTLVELLIGMSIAAAAGLILVSLMVNSNGLFTEQGASVSQGLSLNSSTSEINNLIKQSTAIATQYPTSGVAQYTSDANTLVLQLPAINASGQVIDSVYDYAAITKDTVKTNVLREYIFPNASSSRKTANKVLATTLQAVTFRYVDLSGNTVAPTQATRISFTINLTEKAGTGTKTSSASSDVNLKNN